MRSLRGRLVAILLLVALGGMIVLAAVTFAEQRSYLYDKLDRQVQSGLVTAGPVLAFAQTVRQRELPGHARRTPDHSDGR